MKFFLYDPNNQNQIDSAALEVCDGYSFQYSIAQFFDIYGNFANANIIRNDIDNMFKKDKKAAISIQWGASCGNVIWNNYSYIQMVTKNHEGSGQPLFNKFPVFYNPDYLDKIVSFLKWLSDELGSVIHNIEYIFICGINRTTKELRAPSQDFATTYDIPSAYAIAAREWLGEGYKYDAVIQACERLIYNYNLYFTNIMKVAALIAGKNGFPCIDKKNMVCDYNKRPIVNNDIIAYAKDFSNTALMYTALSYKENIPANFVESKLPMYYQLDNSIYGKSPTLEQFEEAMINAQYNNGKIIEIIKSNAKQFSEIIKKYQNGSD